MKLSLTTDQSEFQQSLRSLFQRECPVDLVRALRHPHESPFPASLWKALAGVGVLGLPFSSAVGGEDGSIFDLGLAYQEAGRVLCPTALYSTMAFGIAIDRLGDDEQRQHWISRLARGDLRAGAVLWHHSGDLGRPSLVARRKGGRWELEGTIDFVPNADTAEILLVLIHPVGSAVPSQSLAVLVDPRAPGIQIRRMKTFGRDSQFHVTFDRCAVEDSAVVPGPDSAIGDDDLRWLRNTESALQCMEMVGGAQAVLERTVDYILGREQFGRPIGGFQAAQHLVADVRIAVDGARLTSYQALWWLSEGSPADRETAIAKARCNEAYKQATLTAHQLHGGMGYLRETDLHLWTERAKVTELTGGAFDAQMLRLADALRLGGA